MSCSPASRKRGPCDRSTTCRRPSRPSRTLIPSVLVHMQRIALLIGQTVPPLQVLIKLPNYVFVGEEDTLKVALWDSKVNEWTTEGIEEVKLDAAKLHLEFRTTRLAPLAFVVDRCIDYPYTSWYMRCTAVDKALLDLVTKRKRFVFEVTSGQVRLIDTSDPALAHVAEKAFEPGMLLYELLKCGINLMPDDKDEKVSGYKPKYKDAEERAIFELASSVNAFAFRSSVWNKSLTAGNARQNCRPSGHEHKTQPCVR
eukprot:TRINITY_DN6602_c0_g1_i23.p2 TRINITY_DN6602_c0_g1~~TRINITY_DN6602_c0_g1_i23.p2  ORF type:complete len:256 (+),score=25.65 TRINITY_DN6602_c0_g1_i23:101-868(+)